MKTLLINQVFVSPDEPGHTRHYELGQYLQQHGHELTIVASNLNYQTGRRTIEKKRLVTEQTIDGIRVLRTYMLPAIHRTFVWRIIAFFSFMVTSVCAGLRAGKVDLVMGTSPPIFQAVSAWGVAALRRKPFLFEVRDLWPEFGIDMGVLKNPIIIQFSRWLEMFLYARATHIVVNSPAYVDYLHSKGVPEGKISFIPYGTDTDMFNPDIDSRWLRQELGLDDKFLAVYAGALGLANDIPTLLRAAARLRDESGIQIVFFGDGKERLNLQKMAKDLKLTNVTFAGTRPKSDMPQVLAAADVCIAILQDISMFRTTYPNKVFDYMAAGRPTILAIDGVIRQVIEQAAGGIFVNPGDDEALANAIKQLYADRKQLRHMGTAARAHVCKHFDRKQCAVEFIDMMNRVAG